MNLPDEVIHMIFGFLPYDDVSRSRLVCKQFNSVGGGFLNHGFRRVVNLHTNCLKNIKDALPRRESERRKHPLYPRHDVLQAIETRLSLLSMTYSRYIQIGCCCFIPGKVLDELFRILHIVGRHEITMPSAITLLQEMRDISSMAMEHFDEQILPNIGVQKDRCFVRFSVRDTGSPKVIASPATLGLESIMASEEEAEQRREVRPRTSRQTRERRVISLLKAKVVKQGNRIRQMSSKQQQLENSISTLSQTVHELSGRLSEVVKEVHTHQCILESRAKDPTLLLDPIPTGDLNNNALEKLPTVLPTGKCTGKRQLTDEPSTSDTFLKKRVKR